MHDRKQTPRVVDQPEPGFFGLRMVKGGPIVAARIFCDRGIWSASIDGKMCGPPHHDPVHAAGVTRIWHHAERSTVDVYEFRLRKCAWAREHAPDHPMANPERPIDLNAMGSLF